MNYIQGTHKEIDNAIATLAEKKLLEQIRVIYEDITTAGITKRQQREDATNQFVAICAKETLLSEDRIRNIVDSVIARAKWIEEIEELDEDLEEER